MDIELARMVLMISERSRNDLSMLMPILKENCATGDREKISIAIATVVYEIRSEIMDRIFSDFPELKQEYDRNLEKFGRSHY
jgi:hypothetical protein